MTMSHSDKKTEFSTRLRLPPLLENYVRSRGELMGQSINEVVKFAVIQMMQADRFDTVDEPCAVSNPTISLMPVTAQVDRNDTASEPPTVTPPRAPSNSYNYSINKNIIYISNERLDEAWKEFEQHRKETKKAIKPTQLKRMWKSFEGIIDRHGEDGLIECFNKAVECGWQGVYSTHLDEQQNNKVASNAAFSKEDF